MSFTAALEIDGVDVKVHVDDHNDIAISIDKAEPCHFSVTNARLFTACILAAICEAKEPNI